MNDESSPWLSGAASTTFAIAVGTPMGGYMARVGPSTGTLDELEIGALVLQGQDGRLAIVCTDVIGVDASLTGEIAAAAGLERSELALCASHTHSGPAGVVKRLHPADVDRLDPDLRARFIAAGAAVVEEASSRLEPVELLIGTGQAEGVAANRNDPHGPYDNRVNVLATRRTDGTLSAVLVHAACHPTVLGADNRLVSADFVGALRRSLDAKFARSDERVPVLFANGAAGDVSTRFTRQGQDAAEVARVGGLLAEAAWRALAQLTPVNGPIRHARATVELTSRLSENVEPDQAGSTELAATGDVSAADRRKAETRAQGAVLLERLRAAGPGVVPVSLELDAWSLGDLALLAVPGELFASLGQEIVASGSGQTMVLGYTNGYAGYLVDAAAYEAGTYEALASPYAPGTGERVAEAAVALLAGLRRV